MQYNSTEIFAAKAWVAIGQVKLTSSNKADIDLKYLFHLALTHLLPLYPRKAKTTSAIKSSPEHTAPVLN